MDGAALINSPTAFLGIDPGMSGAVARLGQGACAVRRDFKSLGDIATSILALSPQTESATMELVGAMPGQGVCSMFSFGRSAGAAEAAICLAYPGAPIVEIAPAKWQNFFRDQLMIPKKQAFDSKEICRTLFPALAHLFKREKDHNTADAVLIAAWRMLNPRAVTSRR